MEICDGTMYRQTVLLCINLLFIEKKTIVICLKKCQKVLPIFCLIVFKCLKEFIIQLELASCQVEIEIPEVILYTVKQISESYNLGLEESSTGILGIDQLLIYCTCTIIHALERF